MKKKKLFILFVHQCVDSYFWHTGGAGSVLWYGHKVKGEYYKNR